MPPARVLSALVVLPNSVAFAAALVAAFTAATFVAALVTATAVFLLRAAVLAATAHVLTGTGQRDRSGRQHRRTEYP